MPKWIFQKISGDQQGDSLWTAPYGNSIDSSDVLYEWYPLAFTDGIMYIASENGTAELHG